MDMSQDDESCCVVNADRCHLAQPSFAHASEPMGDGAYVRCEHFGGPLLVDYQTYDSHATSSDPLRRQLSFEESQKRFCSPVDSGLRGGWTMTLLTGRG